MPLASRETDADMAADWAAIRDKHTVEETPEPETPEPAAEAVAAPEQTAAERARDAEGKFVKQAADKPAAVKADDKPVATRTTDKAQATPTQATPAPVAAETPEAGQQPANAFDRDINRPPSTWKPTARAEWEKLPPSVRAEIHRRESDFMAGQSQLLPDAKLGSTMRGVIEPYRMLIEAENGTPEKAVGELLKTAAIFRVGSPQQKAAALSAIGQQWGVDPYLLFPNGLAPRQGQQQGQPQPQQQQQQFRDPRVDQLLANQQQADQARQFQENSEREAIAARFMNETTADGKPARPYLGDVIDQMAAMVPMIRGENATLSHQQVLQEAYDRATWANPEIRALLQTQQQQQTDAQRKAANTAAVAGARRAASVNVPRRASNPDPGKPGSLEDTVRETARALGLVN